MIFLGDILDLAGDNVEDDGLNVEWSGIGGIILFARKLRSEDDFWLDADNVGDNGLDVEDEVVFGNESCLGENLEVGGDFQMI